MRLSYPEMFLAGGVGGSLTGTGTETALVNYTLPAGLMTANGRIEIITDWSFPSSASAKTMRVRWGGSGIAGTIFYASSPTTSATNRGWAFIVNNNSTSAQVSVGTSQNTNVSSGTSISDNRTTATATTLIAITGLLADSSETITLLSYSIKLYNF